MLFVNNDFTKLIYSSARFKTILDKESTSYSERQTQSLLKLIMPSDVYASAYSILNLSSEIDIQICFSHYFLVYNRGYKFK